MTPFTRPPQADGYLLNLDGGGNKQLLGVHTAKNKKGASPPGDGALSH
jgi:hypothetical protein